jgi:hypothetical protein
MLAAFSGQWDIHRLMEKEHANEKEQNPWRSGDSISRGRPV